MTKKMVVMVSGYMLYVLVVILLGGLGEANFRKSLVQLPLPHPEKFGAVKKEGEGEKSLPSSKVGAI